MIVVKVNVIGLLVLNTLGSCTGGSKVTEVYMEVVAGGDEPITHDRLYWSVSLART